jgi:endonuclease-3
MNKKTAGEIINLLSKEYPDAKPQLKYTSNYELLVAVILSAQCTDERVNKVTEILFKDYNTPEKMVTLTFEELAKIILPCGLYNAKAKNILSASNSIIEKFNGEVPSNFNDLISLAGVGRKTADVMVSVAFNGDAIAVDTHVFRVSNRIGLVKEDTPYKTELALMKVIDKSLWSKSHHYLIFHGRRVCKARNPDCQNCVIKNLCRYKNKND